MPLTPNFNATQVLGQPSYIYLADVSTGSDGAITNRLVYVTNAQGLYLTGLGTTSATPTPFSWDIANSTTSINVLNVDMALYIRVDWVNSEGSVLYTKTKLYGFYQYTQVFLLQLTKNQIPNPSILQDTNYWSDKATLHTLLKDAQNAVEIGGDIYSAQNSLNNAAYLMANSQYFF